MFSSSDWAGLVKTHLPAGDGKENFSIGTKQENN
jgi:hypothetical protein